MEILKQRLEATQADLKATKEELDALCYAISHDLRAPLRAIRGFGSAFAKKYDGQLDEVGRDYIQRINASGAELNGLIDGLLTLSRISREPMDRKRLNFSQLASSVTSFYLKRSPERKVNLLVTPEMTLDGDENLLRKMLEILVDNAWKYTAKVPVAEIQIRPHSDSQKNAFTISDNGIGFDMKLAPKLFSAFQRLHHLSDFQGAGLGLACARRIVHRHGGEIWGEATPGEGASFSFHLPTREAVIS